jgi:hypothetical protein
LGSHVLVDNNTTSFQSFGRNLFEFIRNEVHAQWELISWCKLGTYIKDLNLSIWYTTAVARLNVRLVLTVSVAASWTCRQKFDTRCKCKSNNKDETTRETLHRYYNRTKGIRTSTHLDGLSWNRWRKPTRRYGINTLPSLLLRCENFSTKSA